MLKIDLDERNAIVTLEPQGELSAEDFISVAEVVDPFIEKVGALNGLIVHVDTFPGWDSFGAFTSHMNFVKEHHKKVAKIAFVTNSIAGGLAENVASHFVNATIKTFKFTDLLKAKEWILEDDTVVKKHGLSIGMNRVNKDFFMTFKAVGTLTHEDYKQITPLIDSALEGVKDAKIKAIADISELDGWELRAAWDDMKIGLKHGSEFEKIAIIGSQTWIEYSAKVSSWFMSSQIETFSNEKEALSWLNK